MDFMDYEDHLSVGDAVWWQHGEGVLGMYDLIAGYSIPGTPGMQRKWRVGSSILTGVVRSIRLEEPSYVYAAIATAPDARILLVPVDRLTNGSPPEPVPVSAESPQSTEEQSDDPDREVDELIEVWGAQQP